MHLQTPILLHDLHAVFPFALSCKLDQCSDCSLDLYSCLNKSEDCLRVGASFKLYNKAVSFAQKAIDSICPCNYAVMYANPVLGVHSDAYYVLGRIAHEKLNISEAIRLYTLSVTCTTGVAAPTVAGGAVAPLNH